MSQENATAQMRKGILEYCILSILAQDDYYATDIIRLLKDAQLIVVEGTLYPLLTRQKNAGWLEYKWIESPSGPPRKYYRLTAEGTQYLRMLDQSWSDLVRTVDTINAKRLDNPSTASVS